MSIDASLEFFDVSAAINKDGRIEIFPLAITGHIHHMWQLKPNWQWDDSCPTLGKDNYATVLITGRNEDGRLEVFYIGNNKEQTLYHNWQTHPGGSWNGEVEISSEGDQPRYLALAKNANGQFQLFCCSSNPKYFRDLYYHLRNKDGSWQKRKSLNIFSTQVAVALDSKGSLQICSVDVGNPELFSISQTGPDEFDSWSAPVPLSSTCTAVTMGRLPNGELICVFVGERELTFAMVWNVDEGVWGAPLQIAPAARTLILAVNFTGFFDLFMFGGSPSAADADNRIFRVVQTGLNTWGKQIFMNASAIGMAVIPNDDGHLEMVYAGTNFKLFHQWQTKDTDNWSGETAF